MMVLALLSMLQVSATPAATMAAADSAFKRLDYPAALASYRQALSVAPDQAEVLWKLARLRVIQSEATDSGLDEPLLREAEQYARRAVRSDPGCAEARVWLAGTIGFLTLTAPVGDQITLSREIMAQTDTALLLKPHDDVVYSIRGSFYHALGNVGWVKKNLAALFLGSVPPGGYAESEAALRKAIELAPQVMRHQYELAILYIDWGREEEAVEVLRRAALLPVQVTSDVPRLKKVRSLLRDLESR
jgi:tetratricopeptide (TPR) repeat protein